jgi:hypothetical protein
VGTVTNPTGIVKGHDLTHLADAGSDAFSGLIDPVGMTQAQWQCYALLSDHTACGALEANEITLRFNLFGYADLPNSAPPYPPAADLPLTFQANQLLTTSDGVHRTCKPYVNQASSRGKAGVDAGATSGTITITRMDAGGVEGSWDLLFNGDHTTGDGFAAPWCGTPPA